jgi:gamma-glutamyl:cysteine ligase YbdK (ATP-grasp superfamily)
MAKKITIASEIGSAIGAVAARAEQLVTSKTTKKTVKPTAETAVPKTVAKPVAKRTAAAKHSAKKVTPKAETAVAVADTLTEASEPIEITHEAIAKQAYFYWVERGYQGGSPAADWVRAEQELKQLAASAN